MLKKIFFLLLILLLISACAKPGFSDLTMPNGEQIKVKLAIAEEEQAAGLADVDALNGFDGMWFVFEKPQAVNFWMKDMRFPLDIIYLNEQKRVLQIFENQPPCLAAADCPLIVSAGSNVKYALELPAGGAEKFKLVVNSFIK